MNHQAGILRIITKNQVQQKKLKKTFSVEFSRKSKFNFGEFVHLDMACSV